MAGLLRACAALHVVEAGETNLVAGLAHLRINVGRITPLRGRGGPPSPTSFVFFFSSNWGCFTAVNGIDSRVKLQIRYHTVLRPWEYGGGYRGTPPIKPRRDITFLNISTDSGIRTIIEDLLGYRTVLIWGSCRS